MNKNDFINKINNFSETYLEYIILLFRVCFLCWGIYGFYVGFHNIDLGANIRWINSQYHLNLADINSANKEWTPLEMYMAGLDQIQTGIFTSILGAFGFGMALSLIIKKKDLNKHVIYG